MIFNRSVLNGTFLDQHTEILLKQSSTAVCYEVETVYGI